MKGINLDSAIIIALGYNDIVKQNENSAQIYNNVQENIYNQKQTLNLKI